VGYRAPSYGLFKTSLSPVYFYGIPRNVKATGLTMDVDRFAGTRVDTDGNVERWLAFNRARGARLSAMEHLVPEQMYSTEDAQAHGISAVKAIQLAAAEGQKVWAITQANLDQALASIELSDEIEMDIRNSVYAGKEVTAHERPVHFFGQSATGYIVIDPETGAGAYLIGGGENGGLLAIFFGAVLILLAMFLFTNPLALAAVPFLFGPIAVTGIVSFVSGLMVHLSKGGEFDFFIFSLARFIAMAFLLILFPVSGAALPLFLALLPLFLAIPGDSKR
jgi:hypothetical protein